MKGGKMDYYYAHRTKERDKSRWQLLTVHLQKVAQLSEQFAAEFQAAPWGRLAGLLHDAGKFSDKFQRRLEGTPVPVDHATAGAQYICRLWKRGDKPMVTSHILAYVIAGHHAGLVDFGTVADADERSLSRRLVKKIEAYENALEQHLPEAASPVLTNPLKAGIHEGIQLSLFIRMLFSCLVDADSLDTEEYTEPGKSNLRVSTAKLADLLVHYREHMQESFSNPKKQIDKLRAELLQECLRRASGAPGMYSLTLPTGSGKTLISLGFALEHAEHHTHMRRIIFVIPYTSIIEQNANVYREALGGEHVLEHHSNVQHEADEDLEEKDEMRKLTKKMELATENWDAPIVVTTNVQFFESLFSNKRSRCRKLHNLANSIIVLDEAQMMNGEFFKPCLHALEELCRNYGATVVFSTATQPYVQPVFVKPVEIQEIVEDVPLRFDQFRRVRLNMLGMTDHDALVERMASDRQALCIVNTRKAARELFEKLKAIPGIDRIAVFHLSARMCPMHRMEKLKEIRERLQDGDDCLLISTQLIECGVDVDFPVVYRELAGLDSIAQAAGRCNRNRKVPLRDAYVFETAETPYQGWFGLTAGAARKVLEEFADDPISLEAMRAYFGELYFYQTLGKGTANSKDLTDKYEILPLLQEQARRLEFPFETVAQKFELIQSAAKPVLINYDEKAKKALDALPHAEGITKLMRQLQSYVVQLYPPEFEAFRQAGELIEVRENIFQLKNPDYWYKEDIGVQPFTAEYHAQELYVF
ncbi:CRISPR-associated helicase Cas3' [Paenibacillus filicis]|uniref:CRISPR-associated helicase Cas3 n=1 Tax=Paenibacillus filicis TaxID=669464 RepID=A0ABU9DEF5_9BACL